jgi:hypothetical protein
MVDCNQGLSENSFGLSLGLKISQIVGAAKILFNFYLIIFAALNFQK